MKAFLEEYGLFVVAAIIITVIVSIAAPMGNTLTGKSENTVTAMTDKIKNENMTTDPAEDEPEAAGLYNATGELVCSWEDSGINMETAYSVKKALSNYADVTKVIICNLQRDNVYK